MATIPSRPSRPSQERASLADVVTSPSPNGTLHANEGLEPSTAIGQRPREEHLIIAGKEVEGDELRRALLGELGDAALGGVQAELQHLERAARHDDLAVEDEGATSHFGHGARNFGKERSSGFCRLDCRWTRLPRRCAMQRKPSYFGSYCQPLGLRQFVDGIGFHRL